MNTKYHVLVILGILLVVVVLSACTSNQIRIELTRDTLAGWTAEPMGDIEDVLPKIRPVHNNQILDPKDLYPGQFLNTHQKNSQYIALILSNSYIDKDGCCRFDYVSWYEDWPLGTFVESGYCSDFGLVSYNTGVWNTNYLERSNKYPLSQKNVQELMIFLEKPEK